MDRSAYLAHALRVTEIRVFDAHIERPGSCRVSRKVVVTRKEG